MKKKILMYLCIIILLVGCKNNDTEDASKEVAINRQWEQVVVEFGTEYYVFDEETIGFEKFKSMRELDSLDKLDYKEYNSEDLGEEFIVIKLTEDGETRTYCISDEWIWYYTDFGYGSYYAEYSNKDVRELMTALLPVIGDWHYFSEEENLDIEARNQVVLGQEEFYDIAQNDTFSEVYYITGDTEGDCIYNRDVSGDYLYYAKYQFYLNDLELPETVYFYDLISNGSVGYERYSEIAKWDEVDMSGQKEIVPIVDYIFLGMECLSSYDINTEESELVKNVYIGGDKVYVAYFNDEGMKSIFYDDGKILFGEYVISADGGLDEDELEQLLYSCAYSVGTEECEATEDFSYSYDFNEKGSFDFDAPVYRGENIDNPHIVESYMDLFANEEEFTIYMTSRRADGYMEYRYATASGDNYFMESAGQMYGERAIIHQEILYDDLYYSGSFYEDEEPEYYIDPATEDYMQEPFIHFILQYDYTGDEEDEFKEAYYATVNGEEYICERWQCFSTDVYVFCKDGEIIAIKEIGGISNTDIAVEYVTLEADEEKIVAPVDAGASDR